MKKLFTKVLLLFMCVLLANVAFAQRTVSGLITDKNNQPIDAVKVQVKSTDVKTFTDAAGKFSIVVPENEKVLEFTKTDFKTTAIEITEDVVNITMTPLADVDIFELSLAELLDIPVKVATKTALRQENAPSIVSVITSKEIEMYGARDIADVLRMIPGFEFGMDVNAINGLFFRGAWTCEGKALVMIDGLTLNDPAYGNTNFINYLPANIISRVEIIRGPGSAIYGGFAEVATINIITKTGEELQGTDLACHVGKLSEDWLWGGNVSFGTKNENMEMSTHIGYSQAPLSNKTYTDFAGNSLEMNNESALNQWWHIISKVKMNDLTVSYNRNYQLRHSQDWFGYVVPPVNGYNMARLNSFTENGAISYQKKWDKLAIEPLFDIQRGNFLSTPVLPIYTNGGLTQGFHRWQNNSGDFVVTKYQLTATYTELKWNIMGGIGYQYNYAKAYSVFGRPSFQLSSNPADTSYTATTDSKYAFVQYMHDFNKVKLTAGVRYEKTTFGDAIAPRIGLVYVSGKFNAKLLYGNAYRVPLPWQAYSRRWPPIVGSGLQPEKTQTIEFEVGYRINDYIIAKLNTYYLTISDPIIFVPDNYTNGANDFISMGAEGEIQFRYDFFGGFANFAYAQPVNVDKSEISYVFDTNDEVLGFMGFPSLKVNLGGYYKINKFAFSPTLTYLSKRYSQDPSAPFNNHLYVENKPLMLVNFNISYQISKGVTLSLATHNLLNSDYTVIQAYHDEHAPMPANDREVRLNLTCRF